MAVKLQKVEPQENGQKHKAAPKMPPVVEYFKEKPCLKINPESKWPFIFGVGKAKLILEHLEYIQEFVRQYGE